MQLDIFAALQDAPPTTVVAGHAPGTRVCNKYAPGIAGTVVARPVDRRAREGFTYVDFPAGYGTGFPLPNDHLITADEYDRMLWSELNGE